MVSLKPLLDLLKDLLHTVSAEKAGASAIGVPDVSGF